MKNILLISAALFLSGCEVETAFVVIRNVPTNPSFVVVPANDYLYQVEFANQVESYIISSGVSVVHFRPSVKEIEVTKQAGQVSAQSTQAAGGQVTLTERYLAAIEETSADYIVFTYADSRQLRIIKRMNKEVLVNFALKSSPNYKESQIVREVLKNLGIRVVQYQ